MSCIKSWQSSIICFSSAECVVLPQDSSGFACKPRSTSDRDSTMNLHDLEIYCEDRVCTLPESTIQQRGEVNRHVYYLAVEIYIQ